LRRWIIISKTLNLSEPMCPQKISPKYDTSKLLEPTLENYIDVYENQINGWYLDYAKQMHSDEHAGFAALQIVFSYFEGHAVFYRGEDSKGKSKLFFRDAFLSVFPELRAYEITEELLDRIVSALYEDGRCGFFHAGLARKRFMLHDGDPIVRIGVDPTQQDVAFILLDRRKFVDRVCQHFEAYIARLRNPAETKLRINFEKGLRLLYGPDMLLSK
jgi:hypothetical protein